MIITGKNIDLRPLRISDAEFILSIRLNPALSKYLNPVENDLEKQREWIKNCINDPRESYFIIQNKKSEPVGTIRIYNIQGKTFCWGSFIVLPEARSYASLESLVLLYNHAFFDRGFEQTDFDVRKQNEKALNFYLRFGAAITHEDELNYYMRYTKAQFSEKRDEYYATIETRSRN